MRVIVPTLSWNGCRFELRSLSKPERETAKAAGFHFDFQKSVWWTGLINVAKFYQAYSDNTAKQRFAKEDQQIQLSKAIDSNIEVPCPPGLAYLPFQKAGIAFALARRDTLIADVMRLGKTVQAAGVINADPTIKNILVVCPAFLKLNWARELQTWVVRKLTGEIATSKELPKTDIVIANYEIIGKLREKIDARVWDLVIFDEVHYCFPYSTPVVTEQGILPIGEIVEKRILTRVLSYNTINSKKEWKPIISFLKKKSTTPLVKIKHEYGEITCTANHPVWTGCQYILAGLLKRGDILSCLQQEIYSLPLRKEEVLWEELCEQEYQQPASYQGSTKEENEQAAHTRNLRMVQERKVIPQINKHSEKILFKKMLSSLEIKSTWKERRSKEIFSSKRFEKFTGVAISGFEENERKQSFSQSRDCEEKCRHEERKVLAGDSGWKWNSNQATIAYQRPYRFSNGTPNQYTSGKNHVQISTNSLLSRFGSPTEQDCNRNRWSNPFREETTVDRLSKDRSLRGSRVVSVEVLEQGSRSRFEISSSEDQYIYCLEVEDNNNFFADGILVSNCKNPSSLRTKNCLGSESQSGKTTKPPIEGKRRLGLTGTPILNRPIELWPLVRVFDPEGLGASHWSFAKRYAAAWEAPWGWDFSGSSNLEELNNRLRTFMIRRTKEQVLPELPPIRRQIIPIPGEAAKHIIAAEREFYERNSVLFEASVEEAQRAQAIGDEESYKAATNQLKAVKQVMFDQMSILRHKTAVAKIPYGIDYLEDCLLNEEKVVCFAHHHDVISAIAKHFGEKATQHHGKMSVTQKQDSVDRFKDDPNCKLFVGGISSAVGFSLSIASLAIMMELSWVPGDMDQAEKRLDAIDQKKSILVQHLCFDESLDILMAKRVIEKQETIKEAVG